MMGFFSKLARAPWWIFAALAIVAAYFGWYADGLSFGGKSVQIVPLLIDTIPQLEPAFAWLDSMGFDRNSVSLGGSSSGFGAGGTAAFGQSEAYDYAGRAQIFAGFFLFVAVWKLFFSAGAPSTKDTPSILDDPRTMQAILKDAPNKISQDAWDNPLDAVAPYVAATDPEAEPVSLRLTPRKKPKADRSLPFQAATMGSAVAPKPQRKGLFGGVRRDSVPSDVSREIKARTEFFKAKMESDPFDRLVDQARG